MEQRRRATRISEPFTVQVAGTDRSGTAFDFTTVVDNISSGGVYLHIPRELCTSREPVEMGAQLHVTVDLPGRM